MPAIVVQIQVKKISFAKLPIKIIRIIILEILKLVLPLNANSGNHHSQYINIESSVSLTVKQFDTGVLKCTPFKIC